MHPGRPDRLPAEHDPVAAARVGAAPQMPALGALRRAAADAAKAVPAVPVQEAAGIGEQRSVIMGEQRADRAQVGEDPAAADRRQRLQLLDRRQVDGWAAAPEE
jgi:hypothetical protein